MKAGSVTYMDVQNVCERINDTRKPITTRRVRDELQRGSLSTISKHLKAWQQARSNVYPMNVQDNKGTKTVQHATYHDDVQEMPKPTIQERREPLRMIHPANTEQRRTPNIHESQILNTETSIQELMAVTTSIQKEVQNLVQKMPHAPDSLAEKNSTSMATGVFLWQDFSLLLSSPAAFLLSAAITAITAILVMFQTSAYIAGGLGYAALPISIICELSLIALAVFFSAKVKIKTAALLFLAIFSYVLATMSYDLASTSTQEITATTTNNKQVIALEKELETYTEAFQAATKKQENGNMAKWSTKMDGAKKELAALQTSTSESAGVALIEAKCAGLIALRAILMLLNAFFVHALIGIFHKSRV